MALAYTNLEEAKQRYEAPQAGAPGMLYADKGEIWPYNAAEDIKVGLFVELTSEAACRKVAPPAASERTKILGIAIAGTMETVENIYKQYRQVSVLRSGYVWTSIVDDVNPEDPIYVIYSGNDAGKTSNKMADSDKKIKIGGRFLMAGNAGSFALAYIDCLG